MASVSAPRQPPGVAAGRALARRWRRTLRRAREVDLVPSLLLCGASLLIGLFQLEVAEVPVTVLLIPMVIGNLVLPPRRLPWFYRLAQPRSSKPRSYPPSPWAAGLLP